MLAASQGSRLLRTVSLDAHRVSTAARQVLPPCRAQPLTTPAALKPSCFPTQAALATESRCTFGAQPTLRNQVMCPPCQHQLVAAATTSDHDALGSDEASVPGRVLNSWTSMPRYRILWDADNVNYIFQNWQDITSALAPAHAASVDVFAHSGVAAQLVCAADDHERPPGVSLRNLG
jgi:hypothetical protein